MKYFHLLFIGLVFAGCRNKVEIAGTANGIIDGTISLKDGSGQTLVGENLKNGQFKVESSGWSDPDYGTLTLSRPGQDDINTELYLEPGTYTVTYNKSLLDSYPKVTSISTKQNQLSAFYALFELMGIEAKNKIKTLDAQVKQAIKSKVWDDSVTALSNRTEAERTELSDVGRATLAVFMNKYPKNQVAVHLFQSLNFESNPIAYYALFKKLRPDQQNSEDGKPIGSRLNALVHLMPGQQSPPIIGLMPNGKRFDLKAMHQKLILIEFWRAANFKSRLNHQEMIKKPWPAFTDNQLGIVSISFDKKRDWWLGSMRDDKLTWPQVSDLKGEDSPNFSNWAITEMPTYYLLDGQGRILENELQFNEIPLSLNKYLQTVKQ